MAVGITLSEVVMAIAFPVGTTIGFLISSATYINDYSGRVLPHTTVVVRVISVATMMSPGTIIGMVMHMPVGVIAIVVMPVMGCPWIPV